MNIATKSVLNQCGKYLEMDGFSLISSRSSYVKKTHFGFLDITLSGFSDLGRGGDAVINVGLGVRHNRVDEIVNTMGHIRGRFKNYTMTVYRGLEIFPFSESRDRSHIIRLESFEIDTRIASENIIDMYFSNGIDLFKKYSSIEKCSEDLNNPILVVPHPLYNEFCMRSYYGVVCCAFAFPDMIPSLVKKYKDFIIKNNIVDSRRYEIFQELKGKEGIIARIEYVAQRALAARVD